MSMIVNPFWFGAGGGAVCDWSAVSGATGWFDGTSASLPGLADGGAVGSSTNWLDQLSARNFQQGTAADRPILHTTGGPNSQPYIQFVDDTDGLVFSNTIGTLIDQAAYTVFVVIRPQRNGLNDDPQWCPLVLGTTNQYFGISLRNTGGGNKFVLWQYNAGYGSVESTTTFSQNVWYIVECWYDGTNMNIKVNNDTTVSTAKANVGQVGHTPSIGCTSDVAGLYTSNADIGSTARDSFRTCLGTRFGITLP